jgi:hypothetical protein
MKTWAKEVYVHSLLCPALKRGEWSAAHPGRFTHEESAHGARWVGDCFVSRADPDVWEGNKIDTRILFYSAHSLVTVPVRYLLYRILEPVVSLVLLCCRRFLVWGIRPSQCLWYDRESCRVSTHDLNVWAIQDSWCFRKNIRIIKEICAQCDAHFIALSTIVRNIFRFGGCLMKHWGQCEQLCNKRAVKGVLQTGVLLLLVHVLSRKDTAEQSAF